MNPLLNRWLTGFRIDSSVRVASAGIETLFLILSVCYLGAHFGWWAINGYVVVGR